MTKATIQTAIESVGGIYFEAELDSELEESASELLNLLWVAYDEAED